MPLIKKPGSNKGDRPVSNGEREDVVVRPITESDRDDALDRLAQRNAAFFRPNGPLDPRREPAGD